VQYYLIVLLVYLGTDLLAIWGLNLEFGVAGVANLGYIVLIAAGAYVYAVLTLGPSSGNGAFQHYIIGANLPPAAALVIASAVAAAFGAILGLSGLRRVRQDYQALVLLVSAILASTIVSASPSLFNGDQGLALIPPPVNSAHPWRYVALIGVICGATYFLLRRFSGGPYGRALRAMRENEDAAVAIGKNVVAMRIVVQAVGGAFAGLSGALLVGFIGAWSPSAWAYLETLALLTAIIIGGTGNDGGVLVGTILIPVLLLQGVQFLPSIPGHPGLSTDLSNLLFGILTLSFLFLRPQGLIPERRRRHTVEPRGPSAEAGPTALTIRLPLRVNSPREAPTDQALLAVDGLRRTYGGVHAVDGVSFSIWPGSITGLIGPNGAGKSTLVNLISGTLPTEAGSLLFAGRDLTSTSTFRRARFGLVRTFQLAHEFGGLTTLENLLVAAPGQRAETAKGVLLGRRYWRAQEKENISRALSLLQLFGLEHQANKPARELSGGQKRALELLRALMISPRLLLLDEPLAGLSPLLAEQIGQACRALVEDGLAIVLVEHDLGAIERLCDNVIVMAQGRILGQGTMADLRGRSEVQNAYLVG
jgi:branched-chain amino acid transport system permease protein